MYKQVRDCLILYILHHMAYITEAEPIATELLSPDHEYMYMVINLACMVGNSTQYKLEAYYIELLWVPVYGF